MGQTWAAAYRATDGTLHLEFPNGAGGLFDHATGQAIEDGTSPAATANSSEPSPEVAFAGSDSNLRLLTASGTVIQAQDEHTHWTWSNDIFGQHADD